jgi:hypothetical protein
MADSALIILRALAAAYAAPSRDETPLHIMGGDAMDGALAFACAVDRGFLTRGPRPEVTQAGFAWVADLRGAPGLALAAAAAGRWETPLASEAEEAAA